MVWINSEIVKYLKVYHIFKEQEKEVRGTFNFDKMQEIKLSLNYLENKLIPLFEKEHQSLKIYAVKSGFGLERFMDYFFEARGHYLKHKDGGKTSDTEMYLYRISYVRNIMNKELESLVNHFK